MKTFRIVLVGLAIGVAIHVGLYSRQPSSASTIQEISRLERRANRVWREVQPEVGDVWGPEAIDRVEFEILPVWQTARRLMTTLEDNRVPKDFHTYFELREKAWLLLVQSVRENDRLKFDESTKLLVESEQIGESIRAVQLRNGG